MALRKTDKSLLNIVGFYDSDLASDPNDRRSTSAYCVFFGPNLVSWNSKKQHTISKSIVKEKFRSMAIIVEKLSWI